MHDALSHNQNGYCLVLVRRKVDVVLNHPSNGKLFFDCVRAVSVEVMQRK